MNEETATYRRALRATAIAIVALAIIAVPVGLWVDGGSGVLAAEAGVAVAALSGITTQVAMLLGHRQAPHIMAAYIGGSWLLKMLLIVIALVALGSIEGFHRGLLAGFALAGVVATLAIDMWAMRAGRIPYVDPSSNAG
ncbi:hypothetical protein [Demequina muriae]|uniref:ATP synthase protein I n=1 Tax=Demequina muriae TaxID=3051664 RepID=A0ABT8GI55_9MICO|nr:hypothetical protein [Demequina sp. EGI L300058]MDN4481115.1 hypothetical protein [Demequina sp. EGI L300058]